MEGLWPSRNDEFRVKLWGQEAGKLSIKGSQGWSVVLLQHTGLLYAAWTGSGGCGCPPQNQLIVKAVATPGSPPAALGWGESLGTRDLSAAERLDCPPLRSSQAFRQVSQLCVSDPWLFLQPSPLLHTTARILCKSWPRSAIFPESRQISAFKSSRSSA